MKRSLDDGEVPGGRNPRTPIAGLLHRSDFEVPATSSVVSVHVTSTVFAAFVLAVVVLGVAWSPWARADTGRSVQAGAVTTALNATVFIEVERTYYGETFTTTGTGFFITEDGHILTNSHVVSDWIEIPVRDDWVSVEVNVLTIKAVVRPRTPQEKVLVAKVVALDRRRDLALLKASQASPDYLALDPDTMVGLLDDVFVLGFPFGEMLILDERGAVSRKGGYPEVSINGGRIASLRRDDSGEVVALQTDAEINPGNSGGPMINASGELVGVVYAKFGASQIAFAIPPRRVWTFLQEQRIKAKFIPSLVARQPRPVLLRVSVGALLDRASGGKAVVSGPGTSRREYELIEDQNGWRTALDFPPIADGLAADHYIVHVFLEDERGQVVADHRFKILREDQLGEPEAPTGQQREIFENEMTLSDHARKMAAERAVEEGVVLKSDRDATAGQSEGAEGSASTVPPVDLADLNAAGRTYYRGGNYAAAAEIFAQIVAADPSDEVARDYLELARERIALGAGPERIRASGASEVEAVDEHDARAAEVSVLFYAPPGRATLLITLDGESVETFELSLGDSEVIERRLSVPVGAHMLEARLSYGKRSCGEFSFQRDFKSHSRWTLRINLASKKEQATAYLVQRRD